MPQVTVYIRKEDVGAWNQVERKSEFIHNALQSRTNYEISETVQTDSLDEIPGLRYVNRPTEEPRVELDYDERLYIPSNQFLPDPENPLPYAVFYDKPRHEYSYLDEDGQKQLLPTSVIPKLPERAV